MPHYSTRGNGNMPLSYEYAFGAVRAREKVLLTRAELETMLAFDSVEALTGFLKDKNYAEGDTLDELLQNSRSETLHYLYSVVPEPSVFDALLYPNDAHNIKAVIKGLLAGVDYAPLFSEQCTIDTATIVTAVKENKFSLLPEYFAEAAEKAYEVLAHTADARLADAYLDTACMTAQLTAAEATRINFLSEYIRTDVFYKNVKIALRGAATAAPLSYYDVALCDGLEGFTVEEVTAAALKGAEALADYFAAKDAYSCRAAMEQYSQSPAAFEKFADNLLMQLARERCKRTGSGAEAALGFYLAKAAEDRVVHMIAVGIETDADKETTRERLREIYGG